MISQKTPKQNAETTPKHFDPATSFWLLASSPDSKHVSTGISTSSSLQIHGSEQKTKMSRGKKSPWLLALGFWLNDKSFNHKGHGGTRRRGATTQTQDLRRRGGEETEDWREEKQLQHRGAGEEEPEDAVSGMENLRKKRRNLRLVIRSKPAALMICVLKFFEISNYKVPDYQSSHLSLSP